MTMGDRLLKEALDVLNTQYSHCLNYNHNYNKHNYNKHDADIQQAYYAGMKDMLDLIATDNYRQDATIVYSKAIKSHLFVQVDQTENYSGDNEINIHVAI